MATDDARQHVVDALTLLAVPRIGIREWHRRVGAAGSARGALDAIAESPALDGARDEARRAVARAEALGAAVVVHGSAAYPGGLHDLTACDDPSVTPAPPVLFAQGELTRLSQPAVAIVGTRHATAAGLRAAERIAERCADAGVLVISGLARGIDAAAHDGALRAHGSTAAVIGCGVDVAYPADHRALQRRIAAEGLLLTEHAPGTRPTRGSFPERNRLIAALASLTVVVEAGHKSGALLTAQLASALNRTVAAVPGAFESAAAQGSNTLLRDGAQVVSSVDDVLALLHVTRADPAERATPPRLNDAERAIWDVLSTAPLDLDVVVSRSGWAADACLAAVTTLELKGLVRASHDGALARA